MSLYRCLFCGIDDDDESYFRTPTKKEIEINAKQDGRSVDEHIEMMNQSNYEWLVCKQCSKEMKRK